ncbi:hypothetical protein [Kineococcus auxinigenes]|uniref:hypothetical protein n=1 Tax=unclassified Kineococcus TaxID=2621656 RepID=UPI003D7D1B25
MLLGEFLVPGPLEELLPPGEEWLDLIAHVRFECARYEQFDDPDEQRAVSLSASLDRLAEALGMADVSAPAGTPRPVGRRSTLVSDQGAAPSSGTARTAKVRAASAVASSTSSTACGPRPGDRIEVLQGERYRMLASGVIEHVASGRTLTDAVGRAVAAEVVRRVRLVKPQGGKLWVDRQGSMSAWAAGSAVHVTRVSAQEWFPGVVTSASRVSRSASPVVAAGPLVPSGAPAPVGGRWGRATAAEVRSWCRLRGVLVSQRGRLNASAVQAFNTAYPDRPYVS